MIGVVKRTKRIL